MDAPGLRRLTRMITIRLWLVVVVVGAVGIGFYYLQMSLGPVLVTLAVLIVPLAVVFTLAWILRRPANQVPRWLAWLGATGTVVGLGWLLFSPGHVPAIVIFALGVWLLVVGIISSVITANAR